MCAFFERSFELGSSASAFIDMGDWSVPMVCSLLAASSIYVPILHCTILYVRCQRHSSTGARVHSLESDLYFNHQSPRTQIISKGAYR